MDVIKEIQHFNTHQRAGHLVCACSDWYESNGEGLVGYCRHTDALDVILRPESNQYRLFIQPAQAHG